MPTFAPWSGKLLCSGVLPILCERKCVWRLRAVRDCLDDAVATLGAILIFWRCRTPIVLVAVVALALGDEALAQTVAAAAHRPRPTHKAEWFEQLDGGTSLLEVDQSGSIGRGRSQTAYRPPAKIVAIGTTAQAAAILAPWPLSHPLRRMLSAAQNHRPNEIPRPSAKPNVAPTTNDHRSCMIVDQPFQPIQIQQESASNGFHDPCSRGLNYAFHDRSSIH